MKSRLYLKSLPMGLGPVLGLIAAKSDPDCPPMSMVRLKKMVRANSALWRLRERRRRMKRKMKT